MAEVTRLKNSHQSYGATVFVGRKYVWFDLHNFKLRFPACHGTAELEKVEKTTPIRPITQHTHATIINIY